MDRHADSDESTGFPENPSSLANERPAGSKVPGDVLVMNDDSWHPIAVSGVGIGDDAILRAREILGNAEQVRVMLYGLCPDLPDGERVG
jgi:hypothetical protein